MRPVYIQAAIANVGAYPWSAPVVLDYHLTPQQIMLAYEQRGASAQCSIQWSPDDPFATYATDYNTNANWYDVAGMTAIITDTQYTLGGTGSDNNFPARAVRVKTNSYTSGVAPLLTVIQAGGIA